MTAFCACELRSPGQFSEEGFIAFNRAYVQTLERWGIFRDEENPVARSNVCPEADPPAEPGFHAFCYTVPDDGAGPGTFVIAGSGEAPEGPGQYRDRIIRLGDTSPDAMAEKARYVLDTMESRMAALGFGWADATAAQVYTVHEIHGLFGPEIVARGAAPDGIQWTYAHPAGRGPRLRNGRARPARGARDGLRAAASNGRNARPPPHWLAMTSMARNRIRCYMLAHANHGGC